MSEGRWRQIAQGYQTVSAGVQIPVRGPADTIARMAQVAGVSPDELDDAGRDDAAAELRTLLKPERDPDVRGEDETALEWMDRQYELWKQDRDKRILLKGLFESWGNRDAG